MDDISYNNINIYCNYNGNKKNNHNNYNNLNNNINNEMKHTIYILNVNQMKYDAALKHYNHYNNYHCELLPFNVTQSNVKYHQEQERLQPQQYLTLYRKCSIRRTTSIPERFNVYNPALNALQKLFKCHFKFMDKKKHSQQSSSYYYHNKTECITKPKSTFIQKSKTSLTSSIMGNDKFHLRSIFSCYRMQFLKKKFCVWQCLHKQQQQRQQPEDLQRRQQKQQFKRLTKNRKINNYWNIYCEPIINEKELKPKDFCPIFCDLDDNCRCLDCQSAYFDFDDSDCNNTDYDCDYDYDYDSDTYEYVCNMDENDHEYLNNGFEGELINLNGEIDMKNS